jgi:dephospho-CoA kinase
MTRIVCLTGGIASGKSTAARFLGELGAHVIDADRLGHRAYEPGSPAHAAVVAAFGPEIVGDGGHIDRKALGAQVFGKPEALKRLTDIVWPAIRTLAEEEVRQVQASDPDRIIVLGDEVWVNVIDRENAIARATARDNVPREAIERRLDAQLSNAERIARADVVIDNNGSIDDMLAQLRRHWTRIAG